MCHNRAGADGAIIANCYSGHNQNNHAYVAIAANLHPAELVSVLEL